ncbi:MAG TPA: hypothetical protein VLJ86_27505 [Ramlibacter sp.]|nr:hypothetical protein [Ramlibacter sp.]
MTPIVELQAQGAWARIAPALGGRVTSACLLGSTGKREHILHPYPEAETSLLPWAKGGVFPLMPYNGRIAQARLRHDDRTIALTPHPGEPHALHGISQRRAWAVKSQSDRRVELIYRHEPDAHWPWRFEAFLGISLQPRSLLLEMQLVNRDLTSMPAGIGCHPYVPSVAGDTLTFSAQTEWSRDREFLALEPVRDSSGLRSISDKEFGEGDMTTFHGGWNGEARLQRANGDLLRLIGSPSLSHLVVHRPSGSPYLCIEPVSHVPDGFNLAASGIAETGTVILPANGSVSGRLEITTSQAATQ